MGIVLGVDGCSAGWVGIAWSSIARGSIDWGGGVDAYVASDITQLVAQVGRGAAIDAVAIDIPIGLSEATDREAEALARRWLPGHASTVFSSPVLGALRSETYELANATNRAVIDKGLSRQAFGILPRIAEIHDWLEDEPHVPVIEVHPEVCFAAMNGGVVTETKRSAAGAAVRRSLLEDHGVAPPPLRAPGVAPDDVLDAAAAAWTARRYVTGAAERLPAEPRGRPSPAIWV